MRKRKKTNEKQQKLTSVWAAYEVAGAEREVGASHRRLTELIRKRFRDDVARPPPAAPPPAARS